jgi:hypothetical protein
MPRIAVTHYGRRHLRRCASPSEPDARLTLGSSDRFLIITERMKDAVFVKGSKTFLEPIKWLRKSWRGFPAKFATTRSLLKRVLLLES